jgi:hypothetical protein
VDVRITGITRATTAPQLLESDDESDQIGCSFRPDTQYHRLVLQRGDDVARNDSRTATITGVDRRCESVGLATNLRL